MILLKATTETIRITTSSTADLDYSASYSDITTTTFNPTSQEGKITTATTTTIVSAPAASTQRQVKLIAITNRHATTSNTIIVKKDISGTEYNLTPSITLLAGEALQYLDTQGWTHYAANGSVKGDLTAAGSDSQIQFNTNGTLNGSSSLTWDNTTNDLTLGGVDTGITLTAITNEPAAPSSNNGHLYSKSIAGRIVPKWVGPSGYDYPLQAHVGFNNVRSWRGGATTTATTFASTIGSMPYTGASPTAPTIPTLATTNLLTQTYRSTLSTGATAGGLAYIRANQLSVWRGNAAGMGGFTVTHRFALSGTLQAGIRVFAGIVDVAANPTNIDPLTTTTPGGVGLAINTNSGNWSIVNNVTGTARTATGLGASFPVNNTDVYELILFAPINGTSINYRVTNLTTTATVSGSISTNIPAATTFMAPSVWVTNNATAAAQTLDFISTYVETDF